MRYHRFNDSYSSNLVLLISIHSTTLRRKTKTRVHRRQQQQLRLHQSTRLLIVLLRLIYPIAMTTMVSGHAIKQLRRRTSRRIHRRPLCHEVGTRISLIPVCHFVAYYGTADKEIFNMYCEIGQFSPKYFQIHFAVQPLKYANNPLHCQIFIEAGFKHNSNSSMYTIMDNMLHSF